jgi:hypothetical protein
MRAMTFTRRLYLPHPRKPAEPLPAPAVPADAIVQREQDGLFQIGWHEDAGGPFESRRHAEAVAARREVAA